MFTKYGLPLLAVAGVTFAIYTVVQGAIPKPPSRPVAEPSTRPDPIRMISGAGLVEARRENIPIGINVPGVVIEVFVKKGDHVKKDAPLFRVDDREFKAQLRVREAELASAEAQYHKLKAAPRPEDVPPAEAAAEEARAKLNDCEAAMGRTERLYNRQMAPASDYDKDRFAYYAAKASLARALAELERIKRGTWKEDLEIAKAAVEMARSQVESIKINIERLTVRAPSDGEVLQLNVRLGQFAALAWREPMIVLGDVKRLHVRVDIDENDVPLFDKNAEAVAFLKGRSKGKFPLKVEYVEPYMIPKQSLTGANSDRVDTRVLQVVYALPDERPVDVYVGQQMDVFMKASTSRIANELDAYGKPADPFGSDPDLKATGTLGNDLQNGRDIVPFQVEPPPPTAQPR
jgi:multidrug resistance efflux pump